LDKLSSKLEPPEREEKGSLFDKIVLLNLNNKMLPSIQISLILLFSFILEGQGGSYWSEMHQKTRKFISFCH
jgi:hypothetical protein